MMPWRRRPAKPPARELEPISPEDLAWRIGASGARPDPASAALDAAGPPPADPDRPPAGRRGPDEWRVVMRARPIISGATRRLVLGRDASAILFGIVAIVLVAQFALSGEPRGASDGSSERPGLPSEVALGATGLPGIDGLPTIGPVIDPDLIAGFEATPSPVPTPTLAPGATPRPTLRPARPVAPKPSVPGSTPTPRPAATPAHSPATTASPTPTPFIWFPPPPVPPVAAFSCVPIVDSLDISCSNTSTGASSYAWDFGDGGTSTSVEPGYGYGAPGTFTVTLTALNGWGSDAASHSVTVTGPPPPPPVAAFTPSCPSGGYTVDVAAVDDPNATSYAWSFGDGQTGSGLSSSNPYATDASYSISLTVSGPGGFDTTSQSVTVICP